MERLNDARLSAARLWRNPPFRRLAAAMAAALVAALALAAALTLYSAERLKQDWIARESAFLASLAAAHPELENELPRLIAGSPSAGEIEAGRQWAQRFGIGPRLETSLVPMAADYRSRTLRLSAAGAVLLTAALAAWLLNEQRRQLAGLHRLALSVEETVKNNRPPAYRVYGEGEFGLLGHAVQELSHRLQETIARLKRDKQFLKDTIADISHQLKTPLSSLILYVELLQDRRLSPEEAAEFTDTCRRELDRMEWLILTLLKIARLEAEALELQPKDAPLTDTVRQAAESFRKYAEQREVRLIVEPPAGGEPLIAWHDGKWLAEAIGNLIKNAVEHSPPGAAVTVRTDRTPVFARVTVADRGPGIDEKDLPHIFKKFYRARSDGSGAGLGLALAKSIADRHGGTLTAGPNPGGGAKFVLTLPLHRLPAGRSFLTDP